MYNPIENSKTDIEDMLCQHGRCLAITRMELVINQRTPNTQTITMGNTTHIN